VTLRTYVTSQAKLKLFFQLRASKSGDKHFTQSYKTYILEPYNTKEKKQMEKTIVTLKEWEELSTDKLHDK
jgi:hypothetical protein